MIPSLDGTNKLTWKCRLFGCRNESLPLIWHEQGEKHGIKLGSLATVTATLKEFTFKGCIWCGNYRKIFSHESEIFPKWLCSCEICDTDNKDK